MATVTARIKAGFFRALWREASTSAVALEDALAAFQDRGFQAVRTGKIISATSGAGHSVQFNLPAIGQQFTQENIFDLSEEYFQILADAKATLTAAGNTAPTDDQLFATMMDSSNFERVTETSVDYTALRFPATIR